MVAESRGRGETMNKKNMLVSIALLMTVATSSFFVGSYLATGSINPFGQRHYYELLNANFGYCVTSAEQTSCQSVHNVIFNNGMLDVMDLIHTGATSGGCAISATCTFKYVALTGSTVTFAAGDASTGATQGNCGASGSEGGSEITANGEARAIADTDTVNSGASSQTATIVKTFTDTTTSQAVAGACLANEVTVSSANSILLAGAAFTSVTLQVGDTIQITWTLTYSWS